MSYNYKSVIMSEKSELYSRATNSNKCNEPVDSMLQDLVGFSKYIILSHVFMCCKHTKFEQK